MLATVVVVVIAVHLLAMPPAVAQQRVPSRVEITRYYKDATKTVIGNVRRMARPTLTSEERRAEREIVYVVVENPNINAMAVNREAGPRVEIFLALVVAADNLAYAYVSENELGAKGCFEGYFRYLLSGIDKNNTLFNAGRPLQDVEPFLRFADRRENCKRVTPQRFADSPEAMRVHPKVVEAALAFVVLHEMAHHLLCHVGADDKTIRERLPKECGAIEAENRRCAGMTGEAQKSCKLTASRRRETAADAWAFGHSMKINVNPLPGWPFLLMFAALDGSDLTDESRRSHPLGGRRLAEMLKSVEETMMTDTAYRQKFGAKGADEVVEMVRNFRAEMRRAGFEALSN